jgi:hypothetical protein
MAIHRFVLLVVLDRSDDLPVCLYDEAVVSPYELLADFLLDVGAAPPPGDPGLGSDLRQPAGVLGAAGTQQQTLPSQNNHLDPILL